METEKILQYTGAAALAIWAAKAIGKAGAKGLNFDIQGVTIDPAQLYTGVLKVNISILATNKNPVNIVVQSVQGVVKYGTVTVANVNQPFPATLQTGQPTTIVLSLDIAAPQLIADIVESILQNGVFSALINTIKFEGIVFTSLVNIPIKTNIPIVQ